MAAVAGLHHASDRRKSGRHCLGSPSQSRLILRRCRREGTLTQEAADAAMSRVTGVPGVEAAARDADLVIERSSRTRAKQALFQQLDSVVANDTHPRDEYVVTIG